MKKEFYLTNDENELAKNCLHYHELKSQNPDYFNKKMSRATHSIVLRDKSGKHVFCPAAYVAYTGPKSMRDWEQLNSKQSRSKARAHVKTLPFLKKVDSGSEFKNLRNLYSEYRGGINWSNNPKEDKLVFWLLEGSHFDEIIESPISEINKDIKDIKDNKSIRATTKEALIDARCGQGKFREKLLKKFNKKCVLSGISLAEVLRASHIKGWKFSNNIERLDPDNGLLLAAHYDALFDRGLISFRSDGIILISKKLDNDDANAIKLGVRGLKIGYNLSEKQKNYMYHHRKLYGFEK